MPTSLFDRVSGLVDEIGAEKQAAATEKKAETGIPDPGGAEGGTSHPSKKTDDDLQPSSEGFQSADNERIVKKDIPDEIEPDLVDLAEWHTRMRVATKILSELHSPLLFANYQQRYRIKRPKQFQDIGKRLSELTLDVIRIQDELGELVNDEIEKVYPEETE